jgi:hypothetical protein
MVQVLKQLACWLVGTEYKAGMDVHQIDDVPKKRLQSMLRAQVCLLRPHLLRPHLLRPHLLRPHLLRPHLLRPYLLWRY